MESLAGTLLLRISSVLENKIGASCNVVEIRTYGQLSPLFDPYGGTVLHQETGIDQKANRRKAKNNTITWTLCHISSSFHRVQVIGSCVRA